MGIITISTPFNIDLEFQLAPFHKRLLAFLLDVVIIYGLFFVIIMLLSSFGFSESVGEVVYYLLILLPLTTYHLLCEVLFKGQSLGKMALGIKVLDKSGNAATLSQYLLRWLLRMVDFPFTLFMGGLISSLVTTYTQRIGDLVAGTIVIDKRSKTGIHNTIYLEIEEKNYVPLFPEVMKLSDRDISGIRNLLDVKQNSNDTQLYTIQIADRIKQHLKIETSLHPRDLLQQLLQDYNYLSRK